MSNPRSVTLVLAATLGTTSLFASPVELLSPADPSLVAQTGGGNSGMSPFPGRSISDDGRYVAFVSDAANLIPGLLDDNGAPDVFLFDRLMLTAVLVSRAGAPIVTGNAASGTPVVSGDGRWVAFTSFATDLVPGFADGNGPLHEDVYLFDRATGQVTLVSEAASGLASGDRRSLEPVVDDAATAVAFTSYATDLGATGASGNVGNVYLFDRAAGTLTLVSHAQGEPLAAANGFSEHPVISGDGTFVAYESSGHDQIGVGDIVGGHDVYRWERATATTALVSHTTTPAGYSAAAGFPSISDDGRWIAFSSTSAAHVAGQVDTNFASDVFLYDGSDGTLTLVSHTAADTLATGAVQSDGGQVSDDGSHVAFRSMADDLVAGQVDAGVDLDVFLWNRTSHSTLLVSRAAGGPTTAGAGASDRVAISGDGLVVAFTSVAPDLVSGDANGASDVFAFDAAAGVVELASASATVAGAAKGESWNVGLAAGGGILAYTSAGTDLVPLLIDTNGSTDVFAYDRATDSNRVASRRFGTPSASAGGASQTSEFPPTSVSADGRRVAFVSRAVNLVPGQSDDNGANDVFVRDRLTGTTVLVSHKAGEPTRAAAGVSFQPVLSPDGEWVAFVSQAADLVAGDGNSFNDVFLQHWPTGIRRLVSHTPAGAGGNGASTAPSIGPGGLLVAFESAATNLAAGVTDTNGQQDVFLFDRAIAPAANVTLVSHAAGDPATAAAGMSRTTRLSTDGSTLGFLSAASDLLAGQVKGNVGADVFLHDVGDGTKTLVTRKHGLPTSTGDGAAALFALSADGGWVAHTSEARDLVAGQIDGVGSPDVFLFERATGATTLVTHPPGAPTQATGNAYDPWISADGARIAYSSFATNLVVGQIDGNGVTDVFLYDRTTDATVLVSHAAGQPTTAGGVAAGSFARGIGPSGDHVVYTSSFVDLVPGGDPPSVRPAIYLYDRPTHSNRIVSRSRLSPLSTGNAGSSAPVLSADAGTIAFSSVASDLVSGDWNVASDAFAFDNGSPGDFFTVTPCRRLDTRQPPHAPGVASGEVRLVPMFNLCGIPETARAVAVNVTAVSPTMAGHLAVFAGDQVPSGASILNFGPGQTRATLNVSGLALAGTGGIAVAATLAAPGEVDVLIDVVGYFE
jgi:Tol biopolymer transport system component